MGETMRRDFRSGSVYLGDCHEVLPSLQTDSVEIVVTSPPYNLNLSGSLKYQSTATSKDAVIQFQHWYEETGDEELYQRQQIEVVTELLRIAASSVFYNHKIRYAWHSRNKYRTPSRIYHPMDWLSGFPIWCEITTTSKGDTILDPYLGSGTSALVAMREGRRFIGIEREERFFDLACSRIEEAERGQLCLL